MLTGRRRFQNPDTTTWVQIDLGSTIPVDFVLLYPASEKMYPGRDQYYAGEGFPLRFKIETADDPDFTNPRTVTTSRSPIFPIPVITSCDFPARGHHARYVRLTATRLRTVKILARVWICDG